MRHPRRLRTSIAWTASLSSWPAKIPDSSVWGLGLLEIIGLLQLGRMHDVLREIDELLAQGLPPETDDGHFFKMLALTIKGQLIARDGLTLSEVEAVDLLANPTFLGGNPMGPQSMQVLLEFIASIDPSKALELIEDSPIGYALLPIEVALRNELGQETSVAQEIQEVAQDIRSWVRHCSGKSKQPGLRRLCWILQDQSGAHKRIDPVV